jgi:hypothetical protein
MTPNIPEFLTWMRARHGKAVSYGTLRNAIYDARVEAVKHGREWRITDPEAACEELLPWATRTSRAPRAA